MFKYNKTKEGFTILEILVAMLVITIGGLATYAMVQQIIFQTFSSSYRLTAAYLAKEGVEIVRNTRDTNWLEGLEGDDWNNGLSSSDWEVCAIPKYERRVTIDDSIANKLKVVVDVKWTERGDTHTITVQENLYNWK